MPRTAAIVGHNWGIRCHLMTLRKAGWDVDMLVGRSSTRVAAVAEQYRIPHSSSRPIDAFSRGYDLVVIAVPWHSHAEIVREGVRAGTCMLTEHPLAGSEKESRGLAEHAEQSKAKIFVNFPTRFIKSVSDLGAKLKTSEHGITRRIRHDFIYPDTEGRDWLPLLLMHSLDLAHSLFSLGEVQAATIRDHHVVPVAQCESWSWPLRTSSLRDDEMLSIGTIGACFVSDLGLYELCIRRVAGSKFVEQLVVEGSRGCLAYQTVLERTNEFSPWSASPLWFGPPGMTPRFGVDTHCTGRDIWLDAHFSQLDAISCLLDGRADAKVADADSAVIVHALLERAIDIAWRASNQRGTR